MKILLTGASGFIGRAVLAQLRDRQLEFVACARHGRILNGITIHAMDFSTLSDLELRSCLQHYRCTHLLHLAWNVNPGFWHSHDNLDWVSHTMRLIRAFLDTDGEVIIAAGSCAEYDMRHPGPWSEDSPASGNTLYAASKIATHAILEQACLNAGLRFAWARIAYPYGPDEHPEKFISSHIAKCLARVPIEIREPLKHVDYIHVNDIARAFLTLATHPDAQGTYNIATGSSVRLDHLVHAICRLVGDGASVTYLDNDAIDCLLSAGRLMELGWQPKTTLAEGLNSMVARSALLL